MVLETAVKKIPYLEEDDPVASWTAADADQAARIEALLVALGFKGAAVGTSPAMALTAASTASAAVAFPAGRFTGTPILFAALKHVGTGTAKLVPRGVATSTTAGSVQVFTGDGTNVTATGVVVVWVAIEV